MTLLPPRGGHLGTRGAGSCSARLLPASGAAHKSRWRRITQPGKMQPGLAAPGQGGLGVQQPRGGPPEAALGGGGGQDAL